jgi:hypothetical protein
MEQSTSRNLARQLTSLSRGAILGLLTVLTVSCGSASPSSPSGPNLNGTWSGTFGGSSGSATLTVALTQTGQNLSGSGSLLLLAEGQAFPFSSLSGSASGTSFTFTFDIGGSSVAPSARKRVASVGCVITVSGTATSGSLVGTYSATNPCGPDVVGGQVSLGSSTTSCSQDSTTYTVPVTNQQIYVCDDGKRGPGTVMFATHALIFFPSACLSGLTTVHLSDMLDEIEANVYKNLSPADLAEWQAFVGSRNAPAAEFKLAYLGYLNGFGTNRGINAFPLDLQDNDSIRAFEFLFVVPLFYDPVYDPASFPSVEDFGYGGGSGGECSTSLSATAGICPGFAVIDYPWTVSMGALVLSRQQIYFPLQTLNGSTSLVTQCFSTGSGGCLHGPSAEPIYPFRVPAFFARVVLGL